jgi:hypothetical protein
MCWDISYFSLAVDGQQPDSVILLFEIANYPHSTAFAFSRYRLTELSDTA